MNAIVLTDDELKVLEKRFGPATRQMGPWNSDGTFGYSSIPVAAIEAAAQAMENPDLDAAVSHLRQTPERTKCFVELLATFGPALIDRIVAVYREGTLKSTYGNRPVSPSRRRETRGILAVGVSLRQTDSHDSGRGSSGVAVFP